MLSRRAFIKRLVGLGVGVLGVHEALKAEPPIHEWPARSIENARRELNKIHPEPYIFMSKDNFEDLKRLVRVEGIHDPMIDGEMGQLFGFKIVVS